MQVVIATSNEGKLREARSILAASALEIVSLPLWLGDVETGTTYLQNARLKAASAMRLLGRPTLAEDAGLEVDALHGLPGVRSARFAGPDAHAHANNAKLLALMHNVTKRSARYRAVAVLLFPSGREIVGEGVWEGTMATEPTGTGGFGYDPLFIPAGDTRTAAELSTDEKDRASHRGQALRALVAAI